MSVLFNHAIRYEWLEQGKNPITLVRQSTARQKTPEVLDPQEIQNLLLHLELPYHLMVLLAATTGLRRSELFALKWDDIDFTDRTINVTPLSTVKSSETVRRKPRRKLFRWPIMWRRNCRHGRSKVPTSSQMTGCLPALTIREHCRIGRPYS